MGFAKKQKRGLRRQLQTKSAGSLTIEEEEKREAMGAMRELIDCVYVAKDSGASKEEVVQLMQQSWLMTPMMLLIPQATEIIEKIFSQKVF